MVGATAAPLDVGLAEVLIPGVAAEELLRLQTDLPSDWKERPYRDTVRQIGDKWSKSNQSLALRVPSAVCEGECNVVLNPEHPDFVKLRLDHLGPMKLDPRLRI